MTAPVLAAALAGAILAIARRSNRAVAALFLLWIILFYVSVEKSPAKPFPFFARYLHPIVPCVAALAGAALHEAWRWASKRGRLKYAAPLATAAVLAWPTAKTAITVAELFPDTRELAHAWAVEHLPKRSRLAIDGSYYSPSFGDEFRAKEKSVCGADAPVPRLKKLDFVITSDFKYERYFANEDHVEGARTRADCYRWMFERCDLAARFAPRYAFQGVGFHNPEIRVYDTRKCRRQLR